MLFWSKRTLKNEPKQYLAPLPLGGHEKFRINCAFLFTKTVKFWFVEPTLWTTSAVQNCIVHHQPALCTMETNFKKKGVTSNIFKEHRLRWCMPYGILVVETVLTGYILFKVHNVPIIHYGDLVPTE